MDKLIDGELYDGETGELINELEQVEVEILEDNLPEIICIGGTHIQTNTEQLEKELITYLEKYDIEVTAETEKECSKKATELNKLAKDLNSKRLEVGREIAKPAKDLKDTVDNLMKIVLDKRTELLEGVEVFKAKRFEIIRGLLEQERDKLFSDMKVGESYQFLDIESLVVEGSLGKSKLSKKANEALESMVRRIKALEDAVKIRTLELKVTCIDAGLQFPIEIHQVEAFIKEDDYDDRLSIMIEAQLKVEAQVKERAEKEEQQKRLLLQQEEERKARVEKEEQVRVKRESELKQQQELQKVEDEKNEEIAKIKRDAEEKENQRLAEIKQKEDDELEKQRVIKEGLKKLEKERYEAEQRNNKKTVTLDAVFDVEVPLNIDAEKVHAKFKKQLDEMFTTTLKSLTVR